LLVGVARAELMASAEESVEEGKHEEGTPFEQTRSAKKARSVPSVAAIDESAEEDKSEEGEPGAPRDKSVEEGGMNALQFRQASGSERMQVVEEGDTEDGDADDEIEEDDPAEDPAEKTVREAAEVTA
jgi:hypothetical protein